MSYHVFCHLSAITAVRPMESDVERYYHIPWQTHTGWALLLHVVDHTKESGDQGHAHNWQTNTGWALPLHVVDHTRESGGQCHAHSWQTNTGWALLLHVVDHTRESGGQCHAHSRHNPVSSHTWDWTINTCNTSLTKHLVRSHYMTVDDRPTSLWYRGSVIYWSIALIYITPPHTPVVWVSTQTLWQIRNRSFYKTTFRWLDNHGGKILSYLIHQYNRCQR